MVIHVKFIGLNNFKQSNALLGNKYKEPIAFEFWRLSLLFYLWKTSNITFMNKFSYQNKIVSRIGTFSGHEFCL